MASSRLYLEGLKQFRAHTQNNFKDSKDIGMLQNFPAHKGAKEQADELMKRAGKKYSSRPWINKLMANIGRIVTIGNHATTGAPESVGLAWFAVKLTLSAMQSNYQLYVLIESALMDIADIMILIPHYDRLYDGRFDSE